MEDKQPLTVKLSEEKFAVMPGDPNEEPVWMTKEGMAKMIENEKFPKP